jgi:hypothetical protein
MMGTPAEKETTEFILETLKAVGLSPYTEEIQWSNAFVVARKILITLFIPWLVIFNISLRIDGTAGGILSILTPLLALTFLILAGKAVLDDKFSYLGKTSPGRNVICDLPPTSGKEPERTIYLTAHTDSVGSSLPKLNLVLTIGSMVFFLVALISTLIGGVAILIGEGSGPEMRIRFVLIAAVADMILIVLSLFAKRVNTSPGAIDNGSGSAVLLSLAEEFRNSPLQNTALRFIFCAAEEWGLYGSKGYVRSHQEELEAGIGRDQVINVDMVGSELAYVEKAGLIIKKPLNKNLNNLIARAAEMNEIEVRVFNTPFAPNSDHAPFRKLKMETAFFLSKKDTKKIHKPLDTIDGVDPQKLEDAVNLITAVVKEIDRG